ncbi:hypothetical protein YC2023_018677 [Brassica napus]
MDGNTHICLPEYAEKFTRTMPKPDTYNRAEIDDMVHGNYRAQEMSMNDYYKRLNDVYYPIDNNITMLTARMNELKEEIDIIRRQSEIRAKEYPSIDDHTRPSIDANHTSFKGRLVTVKLLEDKLDEIGFFQNFLKEDISQRFQNILETTHAGLRMHQGCIGHLQKRMHANEVAKEIMKNQ